MAGSKSSRPEFFHLSSNDKQVIKKLEMLTESVERVYPSIKTLMIRSFAQGVFFALGSTIGLSIILALITYLLAVLQIIPPLSDFFKSLQIQSAFSKV